MHSLSRLKTCNDENDQIETTAQQLKSLMKMIQKLQIGHSRIIKVMIYRDMFKRRLWSPRGTFTRKCVKKKKHAKIRIRRD